MKWYAMAAAFFLGLMLGPVAHALMELVVRWITGNSVK